MIVVSSDLGFHATVKTDARGAFLLTLPYGRYELKVQNGRAAPSSIFITIEPLRNQDLHLMVTSSGNLQIETETSANAGIWAASPSDTQSEGHPTAHTFAGLMLDREPATAAQPLNYSGLGDNRLAWQSQRGFSWTGTQFKLLGMDATDSFQPGQPVILPDVDSLGRNRRAFRFRPDNFHCLRQRDRLLPFPTRRRVARRFFHQRHRRPAHLEQSAAACRSRCRAAERAISLVHARRWRKPAARSRNGPIYSFRSPANGPRRRFLSPRPEIISVAECCLATRACACKRDRTINSICSTAARATISRIGACPQDSKCSPTNAWLHRSSRLTAFRT